MKNSEFNAKKLFFSYLSYNESICRLNTFQFNYIIFGVIAFYIFPTFVYFFGRQIFKRAYHCSMYLVPCNLTFA